MGVIGLPAEAYARMMRLLLPPGVLWKQDLDSTLSATLLASADELARVAQRAADLLREGDPRQADELLPEYEADLRLAGDGTLAERQARVVSLLVRRQRFRPVDFQNVLAPLLGLDPEQVVVLENSRAFAVATGDDEAIFLFHIWRDPDLAGSYDLDAAQELVDRMRPAHTLGKVIESVAFKCDDEFSLCDRDLLGS